MGGRHRTNNPAGLRRSVVETAFRAFTARGYEATSVHELRRNAGVSGGAYWHHFPTKKSLALAVINQCVAEAVEAVWMRPVDQAPSAIEGIRRVFAAILADLDRVGSVEGCPLNNLAMEVSGRDPDLREAAAAIFARWTGCLASKMRSDRTAGHGRYVDPDAVAVFVVAAYSGAMSVAKASQSTAPLRTCAAEIETYLAFHADP